MLLINNNISHNPYFNLAIEEYLFKHKTEDVFMLWQNESAIIVGKHQNALAEINLDYAQANQLAVVRRLSGGGTVYHDLGNINFTFIKNGKREQLINFSQFLEPIIKALGEFGIIAEQGKRNELLVDGKKISGNAEHTFKNRILHHGTLLFSANLEHLIQSLRINPFKYKDKAIKSVQSRVVNLQEFLPTIADSETFKNLLFTEMSKIIGGTPYTLKANEIEEITSIQKGKYETWEWNFGYSPNYSLEKNIVVSGSEYQLSVQVTKGKITQLQSSDLPKNILGELNLLLLNENHNIWALNKKFETQAVHLLGIVRQLY